MAVSRTVIAAYKRCYSKSQLEEALRIALHDRATGVMMTQVNFQDGGGSGVPITGDPNEVIEILEIALQEMESGTADGMQPLTSCINFSTRRFES